MNQYFIPIAVGACGLALFLSLSLYGFINYLNRGSGRAIATEPEPEEKVMPGDGRRLHGQEHRIL